MAIRKNADGSITVGIVKPAAKKIEAQAPAEQEPKPEKKRSAKKK